MIVLTINLVSGRAITLTMATSTSTRAEIILSPASSVGRLPFYPRRSMNMLRWLRAKATVPSSSSRSRSFVCTRLGGIVEIKASEAIVTRSICVVGRAIGLSSHVRHCCKLSPNAATCRRGALFGCCPICFEYVADNISVGGQ